jgi:hypothetical protein
MIVGLALKIDLSIGSGSLNLALIGSLLNRACFIYTSPMDLEPCIKYNHGFHYLKLEFAKEHAMNNKKQDEDNPMQTKMYSKEFP